ncbi:MAG: hypothetical protein C5B60_00120 [Chloroflexi bacterium]|nr:MAG: hypothetical protein C5B60_00120 [Chloroflexota bacterium]
MPVNLLNIGSITPATSPLVVPGSLNLTGASVGYLVNGTPLITGLAVQQDGVAVASQPAINFINTASTVWSAANNTGQNRIDLSVAATGAGALPDPTTAVGDLIVRSTTAVTRLPVGSNGTVLIADSALATTGMAWRTLTADLINLNPVGVTWNTVQDAIQGLESGLNAHAVLTTKGDIHGFAAASTRIPVGADNQALLADSTYAPGVAWRAMTADIVNMNPAVSGWTTVQNAVAGIETQLVVLGRGMAYVGYYDGAAGVATFVPAMSALNGPLPAADATGIVQGDYLVVTDATAGPPALSVGDELISGGPTGGPNWIILPIGHSLATVTAATVPLAPVLGTYTTVQEAVTGLNTRAQAAGAANQIQYNAGGTPATFGASADLIWNSANGRLGVHVANPQHTVDIDGDLNITGDFSINDIPFATAGSVNLQATSITGLDGEPLLVTGDVRFDLEGKSVTLHELLRRLSALEQKLGAN